MGPGDANGRGSIAPVLAAESLLRHGVDDATVERFLMTRWHLSGRDPQLVLHAAHILYARERTSCSSQPLPSGSLNDANVP